MSQPEEQRAAVETAKSSRTVPDAVGDPAALGNGRYRIERLLAEGGMKSVHLAHDVRLDRPVAVSVLRMPPEAHTAARLREEAQAVGRLGDHPHIVPVYDVGEEGGVPFVVSQYMAGGSLEDRLVRAAGRALAPSEVIGIATQICAALEHAHGRGIIHRDVKPGNVWLAEDGTAKLGDFGLAMPLDRIAVAEGAMVAGSLAYMAPEQLLGEPLDARTDLYAVGVTLYELTTGRLPFVADEPLGVARQHLHERPVPPSAHNPELPAEFDAFILRLLAKRLEDRPQTAAEVARLLAGLPSERIDTSVEAPQSRPNSMLRLAPGIFVGRRDELELLRGAVDAAILRHGSFVILSGEPGIGKTRTAEEVATYARLQAARVVWASGTDDAIAPPFWLWVQVVQGVLEGIEPAAARGLLGANASELAQLVPAVRALVPDALSRPPAGEDGRARLFESVDVFLRNAAGALPLLLVLDDLHRADTPSLLLLQFLASRLDESALAILGTHRDLGLPRDLVLWQVLAEAARDSSSRQLVLGRLEEEEIGRYVALATGVKPARDLVSALFRETEGNPFFLTEVVRLLVLRGTLRSGSAYTSPIEIPSSVRAAINDRIARLASGTQEMLEQAAVVGRIFDETVLLQVSEVSREQLIEALDEATSARLLEPEGPGRHRFAHALIRDTLYDTLGPARRTDLHRRTGETMERGGASPAELAHHFSRASMHERASRFAREAANAALAVHAWEEAVRLYRLALDAVRRGVANAQEEAALELAIAEAEDRGGNASAARAAYEDAAASALRLGDPDLLARAALGISNETTYRPEVTDVRAIEILERILEALPDAPSSQRAAAQLALANAVRDVDLSRSQTLVRAAVAGATDPVIRSRVLVGANFLLSGPDGSRSERLAFIDEMERLGAETARREVVANAHFWRLHPLLDLGNVEAAHRAQERFRETATELGQPRLLWYAKVNDAYLALLEGRLAEAELLAEQALPVGEHAQESARPIHAGIMFTLRLIQGRLHEAEHIVQRVLAGCPLFEGARCALAYLHGETGRRAEAQAELELLTADDCRAIRRDLGWVPAMSLLGLLAATLEDRERASTLYELLRPCAGWNVMGRVPVCLGAVDRYLGVLAAALARHDDAVRHFEDAIAMNTRMTARPWLAFAQLDLAVTLLARAAAGDGERAQSVLAEAHESALRLGMSPLAERAAALARHTSEPAVSAEVARREAIEEQGPIDTNPEDLLVRVQARCREALRDDRIVVVLDVGAAAACGAVAGPGRNGLLCVPIVSAERQLGCIRVRKPFGGGEFHEADWAALRAVAREVAPAIERTRRYRTLKTTEGRRRSEILALHQHESGTSPFPEMVGVSAVMREVFALTKSAAASSITVLIEGETGTGKELVAHAIHRTSGRGHHPLLPVNCAAIPETLLESQLFGHRRGAFTGATQDQSGTFEAAHGGTILLDEIGDMPVAMQGKLLRVLQSGEIQRVGETRPRQVDVRVIAATHRDLAADVAEGRFREDLYYRLSAFPIRLPPLRERPEDIPLLAEHLLAAAAARTRQSAPRLDPTALDLLVEYDWPGNVRELQNVIERAFVLARGSSAITPVHIPVKPRNQGIPSRPTAPGSRTSKTLRAAREAFEARHIGQVLEEQGGNIARAAAVLGMSRAMLYNKLRKHGLR